MVEHRCFGRSRGPGVMVDRDRMEKLGENDGGDAFRPLFDEAHAEMDVAEELSLVRWEEERATVELVHAAGVVEERSCY